MDRTFTRTFLSRAAMTLLLAVVTTATAWAQEAIDGLTYNSTGGYYEINDEQDLIDLATYVNADNNTSGKTFKQTQPITMTGTGFTPIGNSNAFKGTYDGGNHTITGLNASNEWENTGFIGKMSGGTLNNIILINPTITAQRDAETYDKAIVGALVGYVGGGATITNCRVINPTVSCNLTGDKVYIGGIIGQAYIVSSVSDCYFYDNNASHNYDAIGDLTDQGSKVSNTSRAHLVTPATGVTIQTAMADDLGFTCDSDNDGTAENYWRTGAELTLADQPTTPAGYMFSAYTVTKTADGSDVTADVLSGTTLTVPDYDVTVGATFSLQPVSVSYIDENGATQTIDALPLQGDGADLPAGWYVVNSNVTVKGRINLTGDTNLILGDGYTLNVKGIYIPQGSTLTIYAQSDGETAGKIVSHPTGGAAIGGKSGYDNGSIVICGGSIEATGADRCAGIGSNDDQTGGDISIYGGTITAKGGSDAAAIGGGRNCSGGTIDIYGGTITANGPTDSDTCENGAGIGGGQGGAGGTITIWGGTITTYSRDGAGIGGGDNGAGGTITINGGTITSDKVNQGRGARIGGGCDAAPGTVTINGGTIMAFGGSGAGIGGGKGNLANGTVTINGGIIDASGSYGIGAGEDGADVAITLSWTSANDRFTASSYTGTVTIADGQSFYNGSEVLDPGTIDDNSKLDGKTLQPAVTVPELTVDDVTATTAVASWTACDGVTEYTLQLASDNQFTTGGGGTTKFSEDFSGFSGNGSADIGSNGTLDNYTSTTGWTGSKVYTASEMAKIGASSDQGWIMTPALNGSGTLTVVWSAYRYATSDKNTILLGVSENGTDFNEETITIGDEMTEYTNTFTVSGPEVYVRWKASGSSKARFYLDDISIKIVGSGSLIGEYTVADGTSYTFTGLTPETVYYARVKGEAGWSAVEDFLTEEAPATDTAPSWSASFPATASINVGQYYTLANVSSYVSGTPAPTITLNAPDGLQAELEGDTFTFFAESPGDYAFTFTAANGINPAATVTLTVTVNAVQSLVMGETLLYEGLSGYSGGDGSSEMSTNYQNLDYKSWSEFSKVYAGSSSNAKSNGGCLKIGSSSDKGSMKTNSISLTNGGTLTFYLKQYESNNATLKVTVEGDYDDREEFTPTSDWTLCTVNFPEGTGNITITLESKKRLYVDEIKLTSNGTLELANDDDNATLIAAAANNGGKFNVTLKDRTLYRDGKWNTLCLPFDYDLEAVDSPIDGNGLTVMAFDETTSTFDNGTLTLNFTTVFDNDTYFGKLVAGTPYLIKWDEDPNNPTITNPVFNGVTIDATTRNKTCDLGGNTSITFCGTFVPEPIYADPAVNLYLGAANKLYWPSSDGYTIGAFRAYFHLDGLTCGDPSSPVRAFNLSFGDEETTGIISIENGKLKIENSAAAAWYDMQGLKLQGQPTRKGLYIHGGRKVVIK